MKTNIIEKTKNTKPLVHCITNYVTVNDVANIILASGGSPIMADDHQEVAEMQSICQALLINIGTLNERTIDSMILAGKKANELNHPVILDPVGAGATAFRTNTIKRLLNEVKFDVIKGNISEIKTVAMGVGKTNGVDANEEDAVNFSNIDEVIKFAKKLCKETGAIIAITGKIDIITTENITKITNNGSEEMGKITGTGCMLGGVVASYVAANLDNKFDAVVQAVSCMGICGEIAEKEKGTGSFHIGLIDVMSQLNDGDYERFNKVEER